MAQERRDRGEKRAHERRRRMIDSRGEQRVGRTRMLETESDARNDRDKKIRPRGKNNRAGIWVSRAVQSQCANVRRVDRKASKIVSSEKSADRASILLLLDRKAFDAPREMGARKEKCSSRNLARGEYRSDLARFSDRAGISGSRIFSHRSSRNTDERAKSAPRVHVAAASGRRHRHRHPMRG